jgi:hypothetical protein
VKGEVSHSFERGVYPEYNTRKVTQLMKAVSGSMIVVSMAPQNGLTRTSFDFWAKAIPAI